MEWIAIIFFGLIIMSVISSKMQDNVRRKYSKTIKKVIIVSNDSRKKLLVQLLEEWWEVVS